MFGKQIPGRIYFMDVPWQMTQKKIKEKRFDMRAKGSVVCLGTILKSLLYTMYSDCWKLRSPVLFLDLDSQNTAEFYTTLKKKKWRNMTNPKSSKFFNTVISQKCPMWWLWATTKYSEILPHVHSLELTVKFHTPSKADNRRLSLIWISETRKIGKIKRNRNYLERRKCWHTFYVCECFIYLYTYI